MAMLCALIPPDDADQHQPPLRRPRVNEIVAARSYLVAHEVQYFRLEDYPAVYGVRAYLRPGNPPPHRTVRLKVVRFMTHNEYVFVTLTSPSFDLSRGNGGPSMNATRLRLQQRLANNHDDHRVQRAWVPPPGELVIPPSVLECAQGGLERVAQLVAVSPAVALMFYAATGGRIVAGSLGMKKGRSPFWVLGDPTYTTAAEFNQDCHVWCEDEQGVVSDIHTTLHVMLSEEYKTDVRLPLTVLANQTKVKMVRLGLYYKSAPEHLQRAILNAQLEKCAERLATVEEPHTG